jgi:ABC-2 type transport system ATP-binding protein
VDAVSFTVRPGDICGLLGPNGAGKSTTIRMLLGLVRPDEGEARVLGERVVPGAPVLRRVGALVEEAALYPFLTGRKNLELYARAGGSRAADGAVERALALAGLGKASERKVKTYSHGMRQRLAIAQALLGSPEVLILDEPTTGLDPSGIRETRELLHRLAAGGTGILLSSHLLAEVELACTTVVVMRAGRVAARSTVADMMAGRDTLLEVDSPERAAAALIRAGMTVETASDGRLSVRHDGRPRAAIVRILVRDGVGIESVTARANLEDAFFSLTEEDDAAP